MNVVPIQRNYNLQDSELITFASALAGFMTRDITEFGGFSITAADVTALSAKEDEFEAYPTDNELKADMMIAVDEKDAVRAQLELAIRGVSDKAMVKWGVNSPYYARFGVKGLTDMSDRKLKEAARDTVRTGTKYLADLAAEGLTQLILDDLTALADTFETKLDAVKDAVADRDIASEERIILGNELYALVAKYCEIGKVIWKNTSESKFNDYVITHSGPGVPGKILNMTFTYSVNTVGWDAEITAENYELQYSPDSPTPSWSQIFFGPETSYRHDGVSGTCLYRCRGINANGNGYWSDVKTVAR